jgi:uncharacterized protein YceK
MRRLTYALFLTLLLAGCASVGKMTNEQQEVQTIEQHDLTQDEAYDRLMRWVAQTYSSANDVVQRSDKESGTIIVKGAHQVTRMGMTTFPLSYGMTIDVRDEKVRFTQNVGQPMDSDIGGVTKGDADKMHTHFEALRTSAMEALAEDDDF